MRSITIAFLTVCLTPGVAIGPVAAEWNPVGPPDTSASNTDIDKDHWCAGEQATPSVATWSSPNAETAAANCGNGNQAKLYYEVWSISDQNGQDYGVDAYSGIMGSGTLTFQVQ